MKRLINLFIIVSLALFASCTSEVDDIFDDSSANRMDARLKANQEVLIGAKNGWLMEYYPAPGMAYGGFNVLVSFDADSKVTVAADISAAEDTAVSTYRLKDSSGPVLTFDTYNSIFHFFSDPKNGAGIGSTGKGMEGDYEFLIMEATPEKVVLRGKRTGNKIVMTPLKEELQWSDIIIDIQDVDNLLTGEDFTFTVDGVRGTANLFYHMFTFSYGEVEQKAPFRVIPGGIEFFQPLEIGSKKITRMTATADDRELVTFVDVANGMTAVEIFRPLNKLLASGSWHFAYSALGTYAKQRWDLAKVGLEAEGEELYIASLDGGTSFAFGCVPFGTTTLYKGALGLNCELIGEDQIKMAFKGTASGDGAYYYQRVPGFAGLLTPLFGQFALTGNAVKNSTMIQLQDMAKPSNVYILYKQPVYWPYEK